MTCILEPNRQEGGLFMGGINSISPKNLSNNNILSIISITSHPTETPTNTKHIQILANDTDDQDLTIYFKKTN